MNHVKYVRAGPAEMPFQNWYTVNRNHFHLTDSVRWKSKTQLGWEINIVPHNLVRRIRFGQQNLQEQNFKYLYWTISKTIFLNLFTCKGTYMIDWVGRHDSRVSVIYTCDMTRRYEWFTCGTCPHVGHAHMWDMPTPMHRHTNTQTHISKHANTNTHERLQTHKHAHPKTCTHWHVRMHT